MFRLVFETTSRLWLALEDALLFKETVGTRVRNRAALVLFLAHEEGIERVVVEISECTAKGSLGDAILVQKVLDLECSETRSDTGM